MKKEFLGSLYYRTNQTFDYEIYSTDLTGWSSATIQTNIFNEFRNKYSGDIFTTVFEIPADQNSINDASRIQKYKVSVDIKASCSGVGVGQPELSGSYYSGLDYNFFNNYGVNFSDFKEDFNIELNDNGNYVYGHDLSFTLYTGTKTLAQTIANYVYGADSKTNFGIVIPGISVLADTTQYQDYYSETYDLIKQGYTFSKKREILPISGATVSYNLNHSLDLGEDGVYYINEHGSIKSKLIYDQSKAYIDTLIGNSYPRCSGFYSSYSGILGYGNNILSNIPVKISKSFNKQSISSEYDVSYTTNPIFKASGLSVDETIDFESNEMNVATVKHNVNIIGNKRRNASFDFISVMTGITGSSPTTIANYYSQQGSLYISSLPLKQIRSSYNWPWRSNKASVSFEYTNSPKYFVNVNGVTLNYLDTKIQNTLPVDITSEYKIINRPTKTSVTSYAYQTEKGQISVNLECWLGRDANEFSTGFRANHGGTFTSLYKYGVTTFLNQFLNVIPNAFSYYMSEVHYTLNQDGILVLNMSFPYTIKKYTQ